MHRALGYTPIFNLDLPQSPAPRFLGEHHHTGLSSEKVSAAPIGARSFSIAWVKEYVLSCSKHTILECQCGENLILLGLVSDWGKEGRTTFGCSRCAKKLSVPDVFLRGPVSKRGLAFRRGYRKRARV